MNSSSDSRFEISTADNATTPDSFAEEVRKGLCKHPKSLPSRFFYDATGSQIFEEICTLPEYYLTRAEREILQNHADDIVSRMPSGATLVELGSGSAEKTALLIAAFLGREPELTFVPIDISRSALEDSCPRLLQQHPGLRVSAFEGEYESAIEQLHERTREPLLVLWLGSSIGNLNRSEAHGFLGRLTGNLAPEDRLLIGMDRRKDAASLEAAYDDSAGVTARFNLNLLERINRELGGGFDLSRFRFRARYLEGPGVVESHLVSLERQEVEIRALEARIAFEAGEAIHTENSFKYDGDDIEALAGAAGLVLEKSWSDSQHRFELNLFAPL